MIKLKSVQTADRFKTFLHGHLMFFTQAVKFILNSSGHQFMTHGLKEK